MDELQKLTTAVAEVGRANQLAPPLQTITPFVHFFADGGVDRARLDARDGMQPNQGKSGKHYIRVTNMRGMPAEADVADDLRDIYAEVCVRHVQSHKRAPKKVGVQRFRHALLMRGGNADLSIAAFDDGLIEIGRNYCLNHDNPRCGECPIRMHCRGYLGERKLITEYRT